MSQTFHLLVLVLPPVIFGFIHGVDLRWERVTIIPPPFIMGMIFTMSLVLNPEVSRLVDAYGRVIFLLALAAMCAIYLVTALLVAARVRKSFQKLIL